MKNQFKSGILAAFLVLGIGSVNAQTPVQWTRTLQLEGNWSGLADLNLGGQVFNVDYHSDFHTGIDGNAITMDEWFTDPALGDFKGLNLVGYSPYDDQIHWFSVDNFGTAHEHTGSWSNPRHFYMEHHSFQGGLPFAEYIDFRLRANNQRLVVNLVVTLGPDTIETISGTLYKQNSNIRNGAEGISGEPVTKVYPNPATGSVFVESDEIIDEISVINESGQLIYEAKPQEADHEIQLKVSGIYFVKIISGSNIVTEKILIQK